jgi:hypothetical protein
MLYTVDRIHSACLSVCLPACLSVCLPACLSACLPVCVSVCLSVCLSACLCACLSASLPVCVSVCLPACPCLSACLPACLMYENQQLSSNRPGMGRVIQGCYVPSYCCISFTSTAFSCTGKKRRTCLFTKSRSDVRSREQMFGNSPRLGHGSRIIDENILFTLKKNKGIQSVFFSPV